ncbi:MAG: imidazolonepropionase [Candidatus Nanopelagicales bacterium]
MTVVGWTNIGELCTADPTAGKGQLGILRDAAVVAVDGRIAWIGPAAQFPDVDVAYDMAGAAVLPGFVDAHMHPVFAGDRAAEFDARMSGTPYSAGGIRTTVAATRAASDEQLASNAARLAAEALRQGTTTIEAKSGYGLTVEDEARSLVAARTVTEETTFLGAHVVPAEYADRPDDYVDLVAGEMLDACAPHARGADVFIERGAFDSDQARRILEAAKAKGLGLRVHANQLTQGAGVRLAVEMGAASVDHCTHLGDDDIEALAGSGTVATLVPGAEFSTRSTYAPARRLWDAGATVAIASDCNPGSSYTTSMPLMIALAVREMGMTPAEAVWSATAGGAASLRRDDIGVLAPGRCADLIALDAPSHVHLAYRPGVPLVTRVWRAAATP